MRIFCVTFFAFSFSFLLAQSGKKILLPEVDSIQIYSIGNRAYALRASNPDSAFLLANQALTLAEKFENIPSQVSLWRIKGLINYGLGEFEAALENYDKSLRLAKKGNFMVGRVLNSIGNTYYQMEDYASAINTFEASLTYAIEQGDTIPQIDALINMGSAYSMSGKSDKAIQYYEQSLALQRAANNPTNELVTMANIGRQYIRSNQLERGVNYLKDGIKIAEERKDSVMIANFYRYIANGYKDNGNLEKSLETAQKVLSIREAIGDKKGVANILNAIALIFQDNNDLDEALTYFEQALQIAEESKDRKQQALLLSTIGSNYALRNKCDTALMYFRSSLSLLKDQQFNTSMALPLSRIGACLEQTDQLDSAIIYLTQAYDLVKDIEKGQIETRILITLGKVNRKLKQPKQALQNFRQALSIAESRGLRQDQAELNFQLSQTLAEQGQYQTAFNYIQQYQILKDSLFNEENTKQLARLEATYEFEQEKQALEYQNEQEKQVLDVQIRKQRTLQIITAVALALSLLIFFLVYRLQRIKRRNAVEQEQYKAAIQGKQLQLEQQERVRLEEMDEFKSRFFTNISHEFRTPLTIINGMASQVQSKPEQWLDRGTQMIRQNAQNLLQLVNQILDLRKLESSQLNLNLIQGDILAYLRYIAATHASLAESKGVHLKVEVKEESLAMDFDPDKLMKIISNLLSNAIKFTDTNDRVTLSASSKQQQLKIEIRDTGIGIPKDQLTHIFDRYFQVEHSNNHNPQGSGIGLALTQELVKLLDGEISVESEVHKGTCFTILFPIRQNAPLAEVLFKSSTPTKEKHHSLNSRMSDDKKEELPSLLIVEDNKDMMEFLLASLDEHYQIETAFDGAVGIEKAIEQVPDIIISDVMMPKKNGLELCDTLKRDERTSHIPIVLLTAKADIESRLSGLEKGADVYLAKPFEERELLLRLEKLLELRKTLQARYGTLEEANIEAVAQEENLENAFILKIRTLIQEHLNEVDFGVIQLCQSLGMSRSQVFRKLKALTGKSPTLYIRTVRLQTARHLLKTTDLNVSQVAYDVGFSSPNYFSTVFTEEFGIKPSSI